MGASIIKKLDITQSKGPFGDTESDSGSVVSTNLSIPETDILVENWSQEVDIEVPTEEVEKMISEITTKWENEPKASPEVATGIAKTIIEKQPQRKDGKSSKGSAKPEDFKEVGKFNHVMDQYLMRQAEVFGVKEDAESLMGQSVSRSDAVKAAIYTKYREAARNSSDSSLKDYYLVKGNGVVLESDIIGVTTVNHPLEKYKKFGKRIAKDAESIKQKPRKTRSAMQMLLGAQSEFEDEDDSTPVLAKVLSDASGLNVTVESAVVKEHMAGKEDQKLGIGSTTSLNAISRDAKNINFEGVKSLKLLQDGNMSLSIAELLSDKPVLTEMVGEPLTEGDHLFTGTRLYKRYNHIGIGPYVDLTLSQLLKTYQENESLSIQQVCERLLIYKVRGDGVMINGGGGAVGSKA